MSLTDSFRGLTGRRRSTGAVGRWWASLSRPMQLAIMLVGVVYLYLLPSYPPPFIETTGSDFATVLSSSVIVYVLVALGLNVVVGWAGLLDLGYVGFYAIGAYVTAVLGSQHANLPWLLCVPAAIAVTMLFGVVLGTPTLRLRGDYLAIVTLGFGEIVRYVAINSDWLGATRGIRNIPGPPDIGPLDFSRLNAKPSYYLGLTVVMLVIVVLRRLENSRVGRAWTAIREDEDAAELMGVPTFAFKLWAFAIGAAVGGLAGAMNAGQTGYISPSTFQVQLSILFLAAVVLGGAGNIAGAIVGATLVAYLPERFRGFADKRIFVFGVVLVIMMVVRPEGILPRRRSVMAETIDQPDMPGLSGADLTEELTYQSDAAGHHV